MACDLAADPGSQLVHGDLHYDNILAGSRRPWLVIDPKPATGNPEGSVAEPDVGSHGSCCLVLATTQRSRTKSTHCSPR